MKNLLPIIFSVSIILLFGSSQEVFAVSVNSVGTGDWDAPGTWDVGVPAFTDDITIKSGDTVTITDFRQASSSLTIESGATLIIDAPLGGHLIVTGATLSNSGTVLLNGHGLNNNDRLIVTSGSLATNKGTIIATGAGGQSSAQIQISDSSSLINDCVGNITMNGAGGPSSATLVVSAASSLTNNGIITLKGGSGDFSGRLVNTGGSTITNHNTIIHIPGTGMDSGVFFGDPIIEDPIPCPAIGGELIPIETTSLLLAGAQMNAAWLIPVIVSGIGFAIVILRKL